MSHTLEFPFSFDPALVNFYTAKWKNKMVQFAPILCASMVFFAHAQAVSTQVWSDVTDAWSDAVIANHNMARAQYGAAPLTWDGGLYGGTLQHALQCRFQHSNSGGQVCFPLLFVFKFLL